MAVALATVLYLSFAMTSGSIARADDKCRISDFRNPDGTLDITSYLACVAGENQSAGGGTSASGSLPRTGSDTGQLVGLGAALVALGGAAVYGSRKFRPGTEGPDDQV